MTQMLAENLGCTVHGFTRPLDALKALPQLAPGVVITDYYMPQLDGLEFIRRASAVAPDTAFVLITGHNLSADQEMLNRVGGLKGCLAKPFGWRTLADEVLRVWPGHIAAPVPKADATSL